MRKMGTLVRLAFATFGIGGLAASTALAGAPGNTVDTDGCESHSWGGYNHCNTGTTNPQIALFGDLSGYKVLNDGDTSAYASLSCTNGDAYRGMVGWGGERRYASCPSGGTPWRSVCGMNVLCQSK